MRTIMSLLVLSSMVAGNLAGAAEGVLEKRSPIPAYRYFIATGIDFRRCAYPYCGGFFVKEINRHLSSCADLKEPKRRKECHAVVVDWTKLGLDNIQDLKRDFGDGRLLLRAKLVLRPDFFGNRVKTLVVWDAWAGVTGIGLDRKDRAFIASPTGIVCVTQPCPTLRWRKLNTRKRGPLHDLDLLASRADPDQIGAGLAQLKRGGLIVAGKFQRFTGPAGDGRRLLASEFYIPAADFYVQPQACGGFTVPNSRCDEGYFCDQPARACFNADDRPGICVRKPEVCTKEYDPVCSCNGVTYANDCLRQMAGAPLSHRGACEGEICGNNVCAEGTYCCNRSCGICAPDGGACIDVVCAVPDLSPLVPPPAITLEPVPLVDLIQR
ncbi:MAG: DUF6748 domain-containing protein [Gammaproteobacteria bacterium]